MWSDMMCVACTEVVPQWSTHVGNNTVLEDDVVFLHRQEELAVARGLGRKPVAQVSTNLPRFRRCISLLFDLLARRCCSSLLVDSTMRGAQVSTNQFNIDVRLLSFQTRKQLLLPVLLPEMPRFSVHSVQKAFEYLSEQGHLGE